MLFYIAGSVLKTFQHALGDSTWSKGLHYYLSDRAHQSATSDHLLAGIQQAVNEDYPTSPPNVSVSFRTWETQSGFPYITVSRTGTTLTFEQNRFLYTNRNSTSLWWVPINYAVGSNPDFSNTRADFWLQGTRTIALQSSSAPKPFTANDWIIVNIQQSGYYRVNYDNTLWDLAAAQLNRAGAEYQKIHLFNRAQLIDDAFHFARADLLDFDIVLHLMNYLEKETDYVPWVSTNRANTLLNRWITGSVAYPRYQNFMRKNAAAFFNSLGTSNIQDENRIRRYARPIAINIACEAQLSNCLTLTSQRLQGMIDTGVAIHPDLVSTLYCNGMRGASASLFAAMQSKLLASNVQADRNAIITGMGCTQNTALLADFFTFAINPASTLSASERSRILTSAINIGEASIRTMVNFLRDNSAQVGTYGLVPTMASNIAARIPNQALLTEFTSLLSLLQTNSILTAAQVTSYTASANTLLTWQNSYLSHVIRAFDAIDAATPTTVVPPTQAPTTVAQTTAAPGVQTTTQGAGSAVLSLTVLLFAFIAKYLM